jgi:hypothetical protein
VYLVLLLFTLAVLKLADVPSAVLWSGAFAFPGIIAAMAVGYECLAQEEQTKKRTAVWLRTMRGMSLYYCYGCVGIFAEGDTSLRSNRQH